MAPPPTIGSQPTSRGSRLASIRITRRGLGALMSGLATTAAGLALALAEATSAGIIMLAATGLTAVGVAIAALFPPPLVVHRVVERTERLPTVGEDLAVDIHIDARRRTAMAEVIEVAVDALTVRKGARSVRMSVRPLRSGEASVAHYRVTLRERGALRFLPMTWRRTDPLGLFRWSHRVDRGGHALVGPAVVALDERARASLERLRPRAETRRTSRTDPFELRDLRTYVPGDDLRRVHWASSARRNELIVREPEQCFVTRAQPIRVVIDARHRHHAGTLELALSIGASVVDALVEPFEVTVVTNDGDEHATSAHDTLTLLALIDRELAPLDERVARRGGIDDAAAIHLGDHPGQHTGEVIVTGPRSAASPNGTVVFAAGAAPFDLGHWEPGEPTRRAVASTIARMLATGTSSLDPEQAPSEESRSEQYRGDQYRGEPFFAGPPNANREP